MEPKYFTGFILSHTDNGKSNENQALSLREGGYGKETSAKKQDKKKAAKTLKEKRKEKQEKKKEN